MNRIFITLMLLVLIPLTLDARRNGEGFYIGYGSGGSHYNDNHLSKNIDTDMSNISGAYKFYTGYKYDHVVSLEGSFTGYGIYDITGPLEDRLEPKSGAVYLNFGQDYWHNQIRPFGIIGAGLLWLDDEKGTIYDEEVFFSLHYGVGIEYNPRWLFGWGARWAYEADWSRYKVTQEARELGADSSYDNFIGTVYIGVHYKF